MKTHILKLKSELKVLALKIRELKNTRKSCPHGYVPYLSTNQEEFRTKHIAYCLLRGRTLEQIESKLREPDSYQNKWIRKAAAKLVAEITEAVNEQTLCSSAS